MQVGEYLQILDNYTFSQNTLDRVLVKCKSLYGFTIASTDDTNDKSTEELDLSEAWMWIQATSLVGGGGEKKTIGNRSLTKQSIQFFATDKKQWMENANSIFSKYGKPTIDDADVPAVFDGSYMWGGGDA